MFSGMKPGKVCCNAPCHDLGKNHCPLPSYCKKEVQSRTYNSKVHSTDVGINPLYLDHHYKPGKHYADVYATGVGNEKKYDVSFANFEFLENVNFNFLFFFFEGLRDQGDHRWRHRRYVDQGYGQRRRHYQNRRHPVLITDWQIQVLQGSLCW